jgi:tRNA G10  N-methylase Trm11
LDPFCGYGTIPLCLYSNSDLLKSLIKVSIEKINIFGMDMDASCIEKCVSNLNLIKDYIPDTQDHFQKSIQINFQTSSIQNIIEKIPFKISIPVIISIITQPPYGLTIKKSESELEEIYLNLLYLASKLSQHNKIFLCFISIYSEKLIEKINKFQHQMSNNFSLFK